jgi:hypothetical protein
MRAKIELVLNAAQGDHNAETREDIFCLPNRGIVRWRFVDGFGETQRQGRLI